jgi:hypothetical protein
MISSASVDKTCSDVEHYTDEQMASEFERFFRAQPALCEFIVEVTQESGQKIQELSLFLSYMVFKTVETSGNGSAKTARAEEIEEAYRETESWVTLVSTADEGGLQDAIVQSLDQDSEPHLLQYVISELNEPLDEEDEMNDEEKGEVFFVLKTVILSLCKKEGRIIDVD